MFCPLCGRQAHVVNGGSLPPKRSNPEKPAVLISARYPIDCDCGALLVVDYDFRDNLGYLRIVATTAPPSDSDQFDGGKSRSLMVNVDNT